jgi:hypothetical protein
MLHHPTQNTAFFLFVSYYKTKKCLLTFSLSGESTRPQKAIFRNDKNLLCSKIFYVLFIAFLPKTGSNTG